jgi:hypothetical protein
MDAVVPAGNNFTPSPYKIVNHSFRWPDRMRGFARAARRRSAWSEQPVRRRSSLGLLAILLAACTIAACASDAWLDESNPSANHFFDPRVAREIRSFWYVSASQIDAAVQLLKTQAIVSISPERAASLVGRAPDVPTGESLYLIRAIDVSDPTPLRVYQAGTWVEASAGTNSTCFIFRPPIKRQPIVVALPQTPTRLRLSYSCDG